MKWRLDDVEHVRHLLRARRSTLKRKAKQRAKTQRRIPRQVPPVAIEKSYRTELLHLVATVRRELSPVLEQVYHLLETRTDSRMDAGEGKRARELIEKAGQDVRQRLRPVALEDLAERFANRTSDHNRAQIQRQVKAALGIDPFIADRKLRSTLENFTVENVSLIKDIPEKVIADLEKSITRAFASGTLRQDLEEELTQKFGFAEDRARLIARDQIGKLNGQLSRQRNTELGCKRYIWRTMNDDRVRDEHDDREGKVFFYDDPPEGGHPGDDVQCRCYDEPIFDDILQSIDED